MAKRKERVFQFGGKRDGIMITVTRAGIGVTGWYDSCVGIEGGFIVWEELEKAKAEVFAVGRQQGKGD